MKIKVHYYGEAAGQAEKLAAQAYAEAVIEKIRSLPCPVRQKSWLIEELIKDIKNPQR